MSERHPERHAARRAQLAARLAQDGVEAALVTRLVNVHYLTGLDSSNAALLVSSDGRAVLATDGRYATAAKDIAADVEQVVTRAVSVALAKRAAGAGVVQLAVEAHDITLERAETIHAELREAGTSLELAPLGRVVEDLRAVKDDTEMALLRQACEISCQALDGLLSSGGLLGRTERAVARDLEWRMYELGAQAMAFETIVASGPNSAVPHHRAAHRAVERGDLVKIDFGAVYGGYHADCTRTFVVGAPPTDWQREVYDLVVVAQRAARDAAVAGGDCIGVDKAARAVIDDAGYKDYFTHGTGHGVGLEIHEAPTLGYSATGRLAERMTVTAEPGIYLPGRGGVRIEDTLAVREDDGPDVLTPLTKELLVVDA